jgi:hypothetical protein
MMSKNTIHQSLCCLLCLVLLLPLVSCASAVAAPATAPAEQAKPIVKLDKDPHLVGWWKFDETSGNTAKDSSKHRRDGTLKGDLSFKDGSVAGRVGKALKFAGRNKYVEIPGYKGIAGTQARTVAAWIKTESSRGEVASWGVEDFGKMFIFGFIRGSIGVTPNGGYLYIGAEAEDDKWHHVAAVVGKAELPNLHDHVTLYMDGTLQEIHDIGLLDLWPIETGSDLDVRIGRGFRGLIDEVRIYDRPLSEDEIAVLAGKASRTRRRR